MTDDRASAVQGGSASAADSAGQAASGTESGYLAGFSGAAIVTDANGRVVDANQKGGNLRSLLAGPGGSPLHALIERAENERTVANETVVLHGAQGDLVVDVSVVPLGQSGGGAPPSMLILARDLTMERNLRSALVESRQRYKDLVEVNSDFAWETGSDGVFTFVSPGGALGFEANEMVGVPAEQFVVESDRKAHLPFVSQKAIEDMEVWMRTREGRTACVLASCVPLFDQDNAWQGVRGVCRDVTEQRRNEAALARARHREQLLNHIVRAVRDELEPQNMLSAAVASTGRALGARGAEIYRMSGTGAFEVAATYGTTGGALDTPFQELTPESGAVEEAVDGWHVLLAPTHYRQSVNGAFVLWRGKSDDPWDDDHRLLLCDVANQLGIANEQIANHERILALSRTDALTDLLNRRAFLEEELPQHIERLRETGRKGALFYVDLDNFKAVNDVHGHQAGDEALIEVRDLLQAHSRRTRGGDVIARLGGDEFAIWMDSIEEPVAQQRAEVLLESSKDLARLSGRPDKPFGLSVGVAIYDPESGESVDDLVARADAAMYGVKRSGKAGFAQAPQAAGNG